MCARATAAVVCALLSVSMGCEDEAKLRFYYGSVEDYEELPLSAGAEILAGDWYNRTRPTTVITHGFTGVAEGRAMQALAGAYLQRGHNVALLAWECGAAAHGPSYVGSYISWAVPNAIKLGVELADALGVLSRAGLELGDTRLVGHSLGAHVFGIAGHQLSRSGTRLPCIIGLDPSGMGWENRPAALRLSAGAAAAVLVLHTDPDRYGIRGRAGTFDVWPNARPTRVVQPGCTPRRGGSAMFSDKDLCNHNRSWQLAVEAVERPGTLVALHARSYRDWKRRGRTHRSDDDRLIDIGECNELAVPGNYYLVTRATAPYGLGPAGLHPRDTRARARPPPADTRAPTADDASTSISFTLD
ncbi:phospholipase A1-like [Aricia agestis]|uniref:phospholipase A1-like n=1 Tax=Aricia agestis TaxID=91739 RepID=UPI001C20B711|nr:phospholipase A1-like [Aricia agestis]